MAFSAFLGAVDRLWAAVASSVDLTSLLTTVGSPAGAPEFSSAPPGGAEALSARACCLGGLVRQAILREFAVAAPPILGVGSLQTSLLAGRKRPLARTSTEEDDAPTPPRVRAREAALLM
eukprot:6195515-Prymnesium_polylepis.1